MTDNDPNEPNDPNGSNVGVAFALVIGAGLSTALGAAVVFFPKLVKLASRRVLAGALGVSAGVMTYVSFVEIFAKSQQSFIDAGEEEEKAYVYATLCFFGGVVVMLLIDALVRVIDHHRHKHHHNHNVENHQADNAKDQTAKGQTGAVYSKAEPTDENQQLDGQICICGTDPVERLNQVHQQANELIAANEQQEQESGSTDVEKDSKTMSDKETKENKRLAKMGLNTALAIGLHNFPEGLATFVAALDDPRVGAVLAIAIGIHNIPEGLCVALPIYYATGSRWKAFGWALLSGASEPIAALFGWIILAKLVSNQLYGVLFGFVAGMMVIISTRELIPTAHRYDPDDTVVTYAFIGGMIIMSLSLVLFII